MKTQHWLVMFVVMGVLIPLAAVAQGDLHAEELEVGSSAAQPVGGPVVISSLPEDQREPAVAYNEQRQEYLVVWWNDRPGNDDIYAQRVGQEGQPVGPWFSISAGQGVERRRPDVAWNSRRNEYLVVWYHNDWIHARRVPAVGGVLGSEITVDQGTQELSNYPRVAYAYTSDKYVVVWQSWTTDGQVILTSSVAARTLTTDGNLEGPVFLVSQDTVGNARFGPRVAYNRSRNEHLVVWQQFDIYTGKSRIFARRLLGSGGLMFPESIPISTAQGDHIFPDVAGMPTSPHEGFYLVTWEDQTGASQVRAQRLNGEGYLQGPSFLVDTRDGSEASVASVAANERSDAYLVAWATTTWSPYLWRDLRVRSVSLGGALVGAEELISGNSADYPAVASGPQEDFLVVYQDTAQTGTQHDIYGQLWGSREAPVGPGYDVYLPVVKRSSP